MALHGGQNQGQDELAALLKRHQRVLFDAACPLCSGFVGFLPRRSRFVSPQSALGGAILGHFGQPLAGWLYDRIARNRYSLFGRADHRMTPPLEAESRFPA